MIREKIAAMIVARRKAKNIKDIPFLSSVVAELDLQRYRNEEINRTRRAKNKKEAEFDEVRVIKSMQDNATACNNNAEVLFYEQFLPKLMTEDEIREALKSISANNIGAYMGEWNRNPDLKGKADMGAVSRIVKDEFLD